MCVYLFVWVYIYVCKCICVCVCERAFSIWIRLCVRISLKKKQFKNKISNIKCTTALCTFCNVGIIHWHKIIGSEREEKHISQQRNTLSCIVMNCFSRLFLLVTTTFSCHNYTMRSLGFVSCTYFHWFKLIDFSVKPKTTTVAVVFA